MIICIEFACNLCREDGTTGQAFMKIANYLTWMQGNEF